MTAGVIVIGSSGHASVIVDALEAAGSEPIVGLIDDFQGPNEMKLGYRILGGVADLAGISQRYAVRSFVVGIGDNWQRRRLTQTIAEAVPGAEFVNVIHPRAHLSRNARLGCGNVIAAGAVVGPNCWIADGCIVNTGATVDHDGRLEAFSSIGPGAHLGGNVTAGQCTAIGIGAVVKHKISIGSHSVVGAGGVVLQDVPDNVTAWGVPCRVMRPRVAGEAYN